MSRRLRLDLLSHVSTPDAPTGAERSLGLLASGLAARDHDVRIIAPGPWPVNAELNGRRPKVESVDCRVCWLTYYEPRSVPVAAAKWLRYAWPDGGARRIQEALSRRNPDVVHVNCLPHVRGAAAAAAAGCPVVWHIREILPPGRRRRWFAGKLRSHAVRIVAVSEAVASWLRDEGLADRVRVIYNGVEPPRTEIDRSQARARLGLEDEGCLIGLFGQILPHKGAREFVEAAEVACASEPSLRFVLAGPGSPEFVAEIRRRIAGKPIRLLPPQPTTDTLLAACDIASLTTITPDPLPRTILEAMAAGRPVVSFRTGGAGELVEDGRTGLLIDTGDTDALAAAFVNLARDPAGRTRFGSAGRLRAAERFSLTGHVESMEALFREVADGV